MKGICEGDIEGTTDTDGKTDGVFESEGGFDGEAVGEAESVGERDVEGAGEGSSICQMIFICPCAPVNSENNANTTSILCFMDPLFVLLPRLFWKWWLLDSHLFVWFTLGHGQTAHKNFKK